jgi:hypothetical protein
VRSVLEGENKDFFNEKDLADFIQKCLQKDPKTARELL